MELGWERVSNWECLFVHRRQGLFLSVYVDDIQNGWKKAESGSHVEEINEGECKPNEANIEEHTKMFESRISSGPTAYYQGGKVLNVNVRLRDTTCKRQCSNHEFPLIAY